MKRRSMLVLAALAVSASVIGDASPVSAGPAQVTAWTHTHTATSSRYFTPPPSGWGLPANLTSPDNYRDGKSYMRVQISGKRTDLPVDVQTCFWRHSSSSVTDYRYETCSLMGRVTRDGDYYFDLGAIGGWWKKSGGFSWTTLPSVSRIMLKDAQTQKLLMSRSCGGACWDPSRGDLESHLPITMTGELILVRSGASLTPPSSWRNGCPTSWSSLCAGQGTVPDRGGKNVPVGTPSPPATTTTTTTTTTTSPAPGPVPSPGGAGSVVVVSGLPSGTSGDRPVRDRLSAAGFSVVVVDDDALTPVSLEGAAAVVVTSSVVPSKIPAWLKLAPQPLLVSEAYVIEPLGLGSAQGEVGKRSAMTVQAGHPIAVGLEGVQTVSSSTTFGWATAVESAEVVASLDGDPSQATVFAVEPGDALAGGGVAPARRVGYYLAYPTPPVTNDVGWTMFDRTMAWLTAGDTPPGSGGTSDAVAIVIAGTAGGASGDQPIVERLGGLGYSVTVLDDDDLSAAAIDVAEIVVVTSSVVPTKIPAWLGDSSVPMMVSEPYAMPTLGLATARGEQTGATKIDILQSHAITGAATGPTSVAAPTTFGWVTPPPSASVLASLDASTRAAVFTVDAGAELTSGAAAPARRVGWFFGYEAPAATNDTGWGMFDRAIGWLDS